MAEIDHAAFRDAVKERHEFPEWARRAEDAAAPSRRGFVLDHEALPELVFEKREALPGGGGYRGHRDYLRVRDQEDGVIAVTLLETPSIAAAHEALVDFLCHCMAPRLIPAEEREVRAGHVGFVGYGDLVDAVFFVRASTFVRVESVGQVQVDVGKLAEAVDRQLLGNGA